tara:strand:- start:123 stop:359 length:237 start_codon:yes stop_codon:yes gene_type:complete
LDEFCRAPCLWQSYRDCFPVTALVTLGFDHSFASIYFIPVAMLAGSENVNIADFIADLLPVTLGNIVSGVCLWLWYSG